MYSRRKFIKAATLTGGALALNLHKLSGGTLTGNQFGVNDFIENHPDAVFLLRTAVDAKTNASALKTVGHRLGQTLFVSTPMSGLPMTTNIAIKPNLTTWAKDKAPIETIMGVQTDPNFVEGIVDSFKDLGIAGSSMHLTEANYTSQQVDMRLYEEMAVRAGVNLKQFASLSQLTADEVHWSDVPNGVWFNRIPLLWPVNSPGSCLINISKLKSHFMGMTLCSKNLQGTNVRPYVEQCSAWGVGMSGVDTRDVRDDAFASIQAAYDRHVLAKVPRWETPGTSFSSGLGMETHSSRCLDNNSVLQPLINIIEGVYGREGSFVSGPADNGGYGRDIMTNIVIFGKNARHADLVGTYLAGHEPGNFGFFHMALERGLSKFLDPGAIPLYEWNLDGSALRTSLDKFERVPLRTLYLRKAGEEEYHLVNEPYDYSGITTYQTPQYTKPDIFSISRNYPNPFNPSTSIHYHLPQPGEVRIEIYDTGGACIDVLVDAFQIAGDHLTVWNSSGRASGVYYYQMLFHGTRIVKSMVLMK